MPLFSFAGGTPSTTASPQKSNSSGAEYKPITPGFSQIFGSSSSFEGMIENIFKKSVYFTVILAVIMMIAGGLEYMGSESVFKKGEGKERIFAALSGLLIALVSILLISTILPGFTGEGSGGAFKVNIFGE